MRIIPKYKIDTSKPITVQFLNNDGSPIQDLRDKKPVKEKFKPDENIFNKLVKSTPSYELLNHPLIKIYGTYYGGLCEKWEWNINKLRRAKDVELWKMFALIKEEESIDYKYLCDKEIKEFRDYRRNNEEDLDYFTCKPCDISYRSE